MPDFGDLLDVKVFTSRNDASVYFAAISSTAASDADAIQDIASDRYGNGLRCGLPLQIDDETAPIGDDAMGTLNYSAPDGSVVVAHLVLDKLNAPGGCTLTGTATGG